MITTTAPDDDQADNGPPLTFGEFVRAQLAGDRKATIRDFARSLTTTRKPTPTEESE